MCYIYSVNTIKAQELVSGVKKKILVLNNIAQISKAKHITKTVISLCLGRINIDNMNYLKKNKCAKYEYNIQKRIVSH